MTLGEQGRADPHTLQEDHGYLLSSSLDDVFQDAGGVGPSSSQFGGFRLDDDFLEGVDLGEELGEELARELAAVWSGTPVMRGDERVPITPCLPYVLTQEPVTVLQAKEAR